MPLRSPCSIDPVGQPLKIVNSDETAHNIHAWAEVNKPFNESQSSKGVETTKTFDKEEVLLPVRCDVHNWMNASSACSRILCTRFPSRVALMR
jgi:plastocyanin